MLIDVVFTVAVVAAALGTVPEFQFWVADICPPANRAFMGIGGAALRGTALLAAGWMEGDGAGLFCGLFPGYPACLGTPGQGKQIFNVRTDK